MEDSEEYLVLFVSESMWIELFLANRAAGAPQFFAEELTDKGVEHILDRTVRRMAFVLSPSPSHLGEVWTADAVLDIYKPNHVELCTSCQGASQKEVV